MKKYILIICTFFFVFLAVHVKAQQENSIWINVITGANSNWIIYQNTYGNPELEYATTFGFSGGLGATYFISNEWGFSATAYASKLGQNYSGLQSEGETERKVILSYIEVPLTIMRKIPYTKDPTWVSFGPDIMFLFKAEQEYRRKGGLPLVNPEGMKAGDIRKRFNPTDIALNLAYNKMYRLNDAGNTMFLLSFNSAIGITDINDMEWKIPERDGNYSASHNFYVGIKLGLMFKAGKD